MTWTDRRAVELFHLTFRANLGTKLDRKLYAVKGGANLRFFFKSPRFSEDLDLDLTTVQQNTLKDKIERLFDERPMTLQLAAKGLAISEWSAPKQTQTTQRWKVQLEGRYGARGPHTKIEFSRRGLMGGTVYGPADPVLDQFCGQVLPYLPEHEQSSFDREVWDSTVLRVVAALESVA